MEWDPKWWAKIMEILSVVFEGMGDAFFRIHRNARKSVSATDDEDDDEDDDDESEEGEPPPKRGKAASRVVEILGN